jgi:hypothetical protein
MERVVLIGTWKIKGTFSSRFYSPARAMKFSFRSELPGEDDLFGPLRELRSPLSMEKIKTLVFHHASGTFSVWNSLWSFAGGMLAVGAVAGVLYHFSGNETSVKPGVRSEASSGSKQSIGSEQAATPSIAEISHLNVPDEAFDVHHHNVSQFSVPENADARVVEPISHLEACVLPPLDFVPKNSVEQDQIIPHPSSFILSPTPSWYATASSGAVFSHLRLLGEGAEIGIENGWESLGIAFTNASGNRDWHDVLTHHADASSLLFSESDQTIALLLGANYSIGPVALKGELGPAYIISSSKFIDPVTEALGPSNVNGRIGAAAEISAFYNFSDFFQAGVTNITSYRTGQFTSGVLVSANIRP